MLVLHEGSSAEQWNISSIPLTHNVQMGIVYSVRLFYPRVKSREYKKGLIVDIAGLA